ncbi:TETRATRICOPEPTIDE REPEAT (TPR)-CONTAINING PROTEIN-RELATED [Salix purpurea]|uniref:TETRATRICOPEPTIDE REPEAT (TPR)-CONTAINING PROTEIN-RELATED n=1 Tax=Salix purpurea TaxID=77065 RepID=A0A9Q0VJ12_SALPP|nr:TETRATRICOPEPTIDE REPEAT (TPR)-CONTAINING PROTEIN-RELATED [Salix purpurea]
MSQPQPRQRVLQHSVKPELLTLDANSTETSSYIPQPPHKLAMLADLNANPPESDTTDSLHFSPPDLTKFNDEAQDSKPNLTSKEADSNATVEVTESKKSSSKLGKSRSRSSKLENSLDYGPDNDNDQPSQGPSSSREERVSSLKTGLVHVAKKMPKNAHAHFILGLMYQRLSQPQKAILAYEKAEEILLRCEAEVARPDLLSLVQIHHAQCILLETSGDNSLEKELEGQELEDVLFKLKESMQSDIRQVAVWNTLGLMLLKSGRVQSAVSVLSALMAVDPNNYDCLANLGIAFLQNGNLELSAKCFQDLILKDQNHPSSLVNYAAILLSKYGSVVAGAGANAGEGASVDQAEAINVAKECLLAALKTGTKSSTYLG